MKKDDTPQDNNRTYAGHKKVIYAVNDQGNYEKVGSTGWEPEEFVTLMAVDELQQLAREAYERVVEGVSSPLEYHMYAKRLDVLGLSQATGIFQWRIKRHLQPVHFAKLAQATLLRYQEALGLECNELMAIPKKAPSL